jgi:hypothetical protein
MRFLNYVFFVKDIFLTKSKPAFGKNSGGENEVQTCGAVVRTTSSEIATIDRLVSLRFAWDDGRARGPLNELILQRYVWQNTYITIGYQFSLTIWSSRYSERI